MSFTWFSPDGPLRSREEIASIVYQVALARGLDELAAVIALMTIAVEAGAEDANGDEQWWCPANPADPTSMAADLPHDSLSNDSYSCGYFQQQLSGPGVTPEWGWGGLWGDPAGGRKRMTLEDSADLFLNALSDNYTQAANNPSLAGQFAQQVQGSEFPDRYAAKWDDAWAVLNAALASPPAPNPPPPSGDVPVPNRPDYNEYWVESPSSQDRAGTKVDLFLIHTQEGDGNADSLAHFLANPANQVSYHYTVSQAADGGVTVCDVVNTDLAAWAVLSANNRSINACFAGSSVNWTRAQWLEQSKAIDVMAYLAVQDCIKYGIDIRVLAPPYSSDPPGISDHKYVTEWLGDGTHTDVGPNFPWNVFTAAVEKYAAPVSPPPPPVNPPPPPPATDPLVQFNQWVATATDRQLLEYMIRQIGPGDPEWPAKGATLRDKVWSLGK